MSEIATLLDEAAFRLVSADETDSDAWNELQTQFHALAELLEAEHQPQGSVAARRLADLLSERGADSDSGTPSVADVASRTLSSLQALLRHDAGATPVQWPPELGLSSTESKDSAPRGSRAKRSAAKPGASKRNAPKKRPSKRSTPKTAENAAPKSDARPNSPAATLASSTQRSDSNPADAAAWDRQAEATASAATPASEPASIVDPELLEDFVREAQEHLETADVQLLALETEPRNEESLSAVFRAFHTIKGVAGFMGLSTIGSVAHEAENILDQARAGDLLLAGVAIDAIFNAVDALKRLIASIEASGSAGDAASERSVEGLVATLQTIAKGDAQPVSRKTAPTDSAALEPAGAMQPPLDAAQVASPASSQAETLRVDRRRLDSLVDMIGELVIAEAMVQQDLLASASDDVRVGRNLTQLNKITRNLQELSLSLRMVPVRATFQKMARMVRDLSKRLGKPVEFHMVGEETELDKTVVDEIGDPLMHMVRNAVDHGIEPSPEDRVAEGKSARGNVTLKAYHQGGNIYIEIHDDGRGLDPKRLRAKARERGILAPDATLSDRDSLQLIFQPGFSTAEAVTDVSGRGVGMDVVRRNIEALRGSVELRSTPGQGTCVSMRLPLTLAIIDGMAVQVTEQRYILPTLSIVELLRPRAGEIETVQGKGEYFTLRDEHLPLLRLDRMFGRAGTAADPADGIIVVVEDERKKAGLLVDAVLGQQQAVIKSLGNGLEEQPGLAGGAVMPDGRVGLILDVHGLLELGAGAAPTALPALSGQTGEN